MPLPFSFIDSTLNLLIIEDDPLIKTFLVDFLKPEKIFSIYSAASTADALVLLRSGMRFHTCIMDLGISDINNDEFYILRQYAQHCSIIVLTGCTSPKKGATSIQLGARAVFEKGTTLNTKELLNAIHHNTIINIINHRYNQYSSDTINFATKVLIEKSPESVTAWAEHLRITDRQLRNIWYSSCGYGAKYMLFLYTLFSAAFFYYQKIILGSHLEASEYLTTISEQKLAHYFMANREIIQFLLS